MAWFKKKDDAGAAPDPELPLTVAQARRLRELVHLAWARAGREVIVHSAHVVDADGTEFGLWNLAVLVAGEPERSWPALVQGHVDRLAKPTTDVADLTDSQLHAQLVTRLCDNAGLPDPSWFPTAPTLAGQLREVIAVDFPETVIIPSEDALASRGSIDEWRKVGRANLWQMMRSEPREHEVLDPAGPGRFHVLMGESVYTASMALFLGEVISLVGESDKGRGVLVALPHRHQIAFRVIDGPDAVQALQNLFRFALVAFEDGAGPLSPHVFWVRDGRWQQITSFDGSGRPRIDVGPELASALGLAGDEGDR